MRAALCVAALMPAMGTAKEVHLSGTQIRAAINGRYVTDERHWGHLYLADGCLQRSENGRHRDGHWSVQGARLCLLLPEVSKDTPLCMWVVRDGDELQYRDEHTTAYRGVVRPPPAKGLP